MRWVNPPNERSGACAKRSGAKDGEQKDRVGSIVSGGLGHMDAVASGVFRGQVGAVPADVGDHPPPKTSYN